MSAIADVAAIIAAATPLAKLAADILEGRETDGKAIARRGLDAMLDLIPHEELVAELTEAARARAEMEFMAAKTAKVLMGDATE